MFARSFKRVVLASLLVSLVVGTAYAVDQSFQGKIASVGKDEFVMLDNQDGQNDKFTVTAATKITRSGKPANLPDLQIGDVVKVTAEKVEGKLLAKQIDAMPPA